MAGLTPDQLRQVPLFADLSQEQCILLLDRHLQVNHGIDQVFVLEHDWGECLFLLRRGLAKVRSFTSDGEEIVLSLLGEGELFGEMAVLDGTPRSADVVSLTDVEVIKLRAAPFAALLQQDTQLALGVARLEASRLRDLNQRFAIQSGDATTRMLAALAYLARRSCPGGDLSAPFPALAQREVGLLAGLARETASRTLTKLRNRGTLAEQQGQWRLINLQPLLQRGLISAAEAAPTALTGDP